MSLPLPYKITGQFPDSEEIQGNFDALKTQFPLNRSHLKVESPHYVGDPGEPAFQNSWVNEDPSTWTRLRFWRDPVGMVHIEGVIQSGTVGAVPVFTLPSGYLPQLGNEYPAIGNGGASLAIVQVAPTGQVMVTVGTNTRISISIHFRQEQ